MTCADFVCTASSSASRKVTVMTLLRRACALPYSSREPMPACCVQNSLRSCPLVHPVTPLYGPPLIVSRLRLTAAARRKNSSPENLTHLQYNLLGKDSSAHPNRPPRLDLESSVTCPAIPPDPGLVHGVYYMGSSTCGLVLGGHGAGSNSGMLEAIQEVWK